MINMSDILYAVYGASGFGREIMPIAKQAVGGEKKSRLVFIDDGHEQGEVNGCQVLGYEQLLNEPEPLKKVCLAIANSKIREELDAKLRRDDVQLFDLMASNIVSLDEVEVGEGSLLCPFVTLTSNVKIGRHFHANIYSYVAHDCVIGDFVTFAPRVNCNGNVHIHDHAYIGTGAILKQGTPDKPLVIGRGAVVGMGAVVTKDVPEGAVVVGNPAKPFSK